MYDNEGRGNCNLGAIKVDNKGSKVLLLILVFRCPRELLALTSCVAYTKKAHNLTVDNSTFNDEYYKTKRRYTKR